MTEFDSEMFIDEIKLRPCIWNTASEEYKFKDLKRQQWAELCNLFYPDFEDSSASQKTEMCKILQTKWKNLKDAYRRYLKLKRAAESRHAKREVKTYIYAAQMSFMEEILELGPIEFSPNVLVDVISDGETSEKTGVTSANTIPRRRKSRLEDKFKSYLGSLQPLKLQKVKEEGDDLNFFKSLLPIVQPLPLYDKMKLRMDIMQIVMEYADRNRVQSDVKPFLQTNATTSFQNHSPS